MKILLLGSGGREHTIAWKIAQSSLVEKLFIAPGNAGTAVHGQNVSLSPTNFEAIKSFCLQNSVNLVVVGPEEPLVKGIYDFFKLDESLSEVLIIGPSKLGAMLEGSKDFAKEFMLRHEIPTAAYKSFTSSNINDGISFIKNSKAPYVLKADGLAAGKGVIIVDNKEAAITNLNEMLIGECFGEASRKVVIEEFLTGIELSVFVITDGKKWLLLPEAKDYKRIGKGDTGLNTGGMGSVSPVPFADKVFMNKVVNKIIDPTIKGLAKENIDYRGFIFFGLINVNGEPFVIEYNVRMGDPETESVIPRIKNDLVPVLAACASGDLATHTIDIDDQAAATVMIVSGGYPGVYKKGFPIDGLAGNHSSIIFHAGTSIDENNRVVTSGGRVIGVTSLARTASLAVIQSLHTASSITFTGSYYRDDIGFDIL